MNGKRNVINEYHLNRHEPDKPQFALHDLYEYLKTNQCQAIKPHIHSFYQVIWFKKGIGKHSVDFKEYDVFDNAIFFVAPNQVHYFDENTDYEGVLIHFNEIFLVQNQSQMEFFLNHNLFNNPYQQPSCCIGTGIDDILDKYVSQMKQELENENSFGKELILKNYLQSFLIQIQRRKNEFEKSADPSFPMMDEKRMQLVRFTTLIDENYKKGYSVAEYARLLHISSRSLSDLTQQQLNKTPSQMIQERIILEAQRLLLYSNLNINQVGYRLGFDDASYFVKYFKKYTGVSPSEFKKSIS
jgi:AraC-like DNA-binding protein